MNDRQLELAQWVARYYRAPLFDAISPMLPPGFRYRYQDLIQVVDSISSQDELDLSIGEKTLMDYLFSFPNKGHSIQTIVNLKGTWARNAVMSLLDKKLIKFVSEDFIYQPIARRKDYLELHEKGALLHAYYQDHPNAKKQLALLSTLTINNLSLIHI